MLRLIAAFSSTCLLMAMLAVAQPPYESRPSVLDTNGQPLERGVAYYIDPDVTDIGGGITLLDRNGTCPLFVGLDELATSKGLPVTFTPYFENETVVREYSDFKVAFTSDVSTICIQSLAWRVGEEDPETGRRFIVTGGEPGYFRIEKNGSVYKLGWCPSDACPNCRPRCGDAGLLVENDKSFLALDGPALPVVFRKA
ncbi:hypothetical protein SLA2020_306060 [Shorea laevis]